MSFALGSQPDRFTVHLTTGADFYTALDATDGETWPNTMVVKLTFTKGTFTATWTATVSDESIEWSVDKAQADLVPDGARAVLHYVDGSADVTWATGSVIRHG